MSISLDVQMEGAEPSTPDAVTQAMHQLLADAAEATVEEMRQRWPRDSGRSADSMTWRPGAGWAVVIEVPVRYAWYIQRHGDRVPMGVHLMRSFRAHLDRLAEERAEALAAMVLGSIAGVLNG